jgi:cytochrome c oxidase cbb3-type subunit 3
MKHAAETYDPIFNKFLKQDLKAVAADPEAKQMGQRLFVTYCSQCHGSDAGGARGFPNLGDKDWLYGGDPETIKASIMNGRTGIMPPHGPVLGDAGVKEVANYVFSLSGKSHDANLAAAGKPKFEQICAACHTPAGTGMQALGAPNLTDKVWLYGSSEATVIETITKGRNGVMPAWKDFLGEAKVHLLAAYVYGLSEGK